MLYLRILKYADQPIVVVYGNELKAVLVSAHPTPPRQYCTATLFVRVHVVGLVKLKFIWVKGTS